MTSLFARKEPGSSLCAARQPIVDLHGAVIGYELLYRPGPENICGACDRNQATRAVIEMTRRYGVNHLCNGRPAFINCTRETLLEGRITVLPNWHVIAEILENTPVDAQVREACRRLRTLGFRIALDDYLPGDEREPLVEFADYIKADMRQASPAEILRIADEFRDRPVWLLAEKVETAEEFFLARDAGYQLFQGYFFDRPEFLTAPPTQTRSASASFLGVAPEGAEAD
jgi:EAL and modified HD-GYP domain-containing signal transduction protein